MACCTTGEGRSSAAASSPKRLPLLSGCQGRPRREEAEERTAGCRLLRKAWMGMESVAPSSLEEGDMAEAGWGGRHEGE